MKEIVDFYQQHTKNYASSLPWLSMLQEKALASLQQQGFPTRKDEEWKYTQLESLFKQEFSFNTFSLPESQSEKALPFEQLIPIRNGVLGAVESLKSFLPAGVLVLSLEDALKSHAELLKPYLGQILIQTHGFHFLNTAFLQQGVVLYVPASIRIEEPIVLSHYQDESSRFNLRHLIIMDEKSEAIVVEDYQGASKACYLTNTVTEIYLGSQAQLKHFKIQRESKAAYHIGHIAVKQSAKSQFESHSLSLGGHLVRSDLEINLQEENAKCLMNGIYAPAEGQHVDHHTTVHHNVPKCHSEQDYKGILLGKSRAVFNGKVIVAKDAIQSDAQQQNKNLLLSKDAEVDTKPQLEIFTDDVVCSHGATVGQLDEEALFYLATRGIARAEASHYLIHAFAKDNLRMITPSSLAQIMGDLLTEQLEA